MSIDSRRPASPLDREQIALIEVGHTDVLPVLARALVVWFLLAIAALPMVELGAPASEDAGPPRAWAHLVALPTAVSERVDALQASVPDPTRWTRIVTANRALLAGLTAFEDALEDDSPVGRFLRPPAQVVLSGWLGAGNERVYVGRDGWLFYRPDVEYLTGRGFLEPAELERRVAGASEFEAPPHPDPRPAIRQLKRDLDLRGITLVVLPIPVKPTVHPGQLARSYERSSAPSAPSAALPSSASSAPSAARPSSVSSAPSAAVSPSAPSAALPSSAAQVQNPSYSAFVDDLRRDGVIVFDPVAEMARAGASGDLQYLATDTHWRPETVQRVAASLAVFLGRVTVLPPVSAPGYRVEPREARQTGDTAAMLDLPPGQRLYPPERVSLRFVIGPDGDPWRPSRDADVLVLGDSFSNVYSLAAMGWGESAGFVEQLSYALQRPVDRIVQNDEAAHATRALLQRELGGASDRLAGKRVVIWQFAARELAFGDWRMIELPRAAPP